MPAVTIESPTPDDKGTEAEWWSSKFRPFSNKTTDVGQENEDEEYRTDIAYQGLKAIADRTKPLPDKYGHNAPLEHHTFRRVLAYVKVHHNELEEKLKLSEGDGITRSQWMAAWRAIEQDKMNNGEQQDTTSRTRHTTWCDNDELVVIQKQETQDAVNSVGRKIISNMMGDVFNLLNTDNDGNVSATEWKSFLTYVEQADDVQESEDTWDTRKQVNMKKRVAFLKEMKISMRDELHAHQARCCSVDLQSNQLTELLSHFVGESTVEFILSDLSVVSDETGKVIDSARVGQKLKMRLSSATSDPTKETQMLRTYIQTDNLPYLEFGISEKVRQAMDDLWSSDPKRRVSFDQVWSDTNNVASSIVSDAAMNAYEDRLKKLYCSGDLTEKFMNIVKRRAITETEFCEAYKAATGVEIRNKVKKEPFFPLWANLNQKFNGLVEKGLFFKSCMKGQSEPVEGLSYPISYVEDKIESGRRQRHFFWYILWVLVYTFYLHNDLDINKGFYLGLSIDEAIGKEEVGDATTEFFPWKFYEIANEEEFWKWIKGPMLGYVYPDDGSPGFTVVQNHLNRIVGGFKVRQFRAKSGSCKELDDLLTNEDGKTCRAYGDTRASTDWVPTNPNEVSRLPANVTIVWACKSGNKTTDRGVRLSPIIREPSAVVTEIFRILATEELNVAISNEPNLPEVTVGQWKSESADVAINTKLLPDVTEGLYMTKAGVESCPLCARLGHEALKAPGVSSAFSNVIYGVQGTDFGAKLTAAGVLVAGSYALDLYNSTGYDAVMRQLDNDGKAALFYSYSSSPLVIGLEPVRISLNAFEYQAQTFIKVFKDPPGADFDKDIQELLYRMEFTQSDLTSFSTAMQTSDASAVACDWVTANKYRWGAWIREAVSTDTKVRQDEYHSQCFNTWDESNDKDSFSNHAYYLEPNSALPAGALESDDTAKVIYKVDSSGGKTSEPAFTVPSREQFEQWIQEAEGGNLTAFGLWKEAQAWVYRSCGDLHGESLLVRYRGNIATTFGKLYYGCDGYGTFLPVSMTEGEATEHLNMLQANQWIDIATRAVLVEFFVHSQSSRHMTKVQFMVEIASTGAFVASKRLNSFRLFQWETQASGFVFVLGIVFIWVFFFYLVSNSWKRFNRAWQARKSQLRWEASWFHGHFIPCASWNEKGKCFSSKGLKLVIPLMETYFQDLWFFIDTCMYLMIVATWVFRFWFIWLGNTASNPLCTDVYPQDFERAGDLSVLVQQIDGINILLIFLRVMFYLEVNHDMNVIIKTVRRASSLIFNLLVVFLLIMVGFVMSAWVVFGMVLEKYRSSSEAFQALLFMVMGEFDFEAMRSVRPVFALIFFIMFYVVIIAVLFNLLIGVMTTKFEEVHGESLDRLTFSMRIAHDPETTAWSTPVGMRASLSSLSWFKEITFYWKKVKHCVLRDGKTAYVNRNPRIFWPKYKEMLEDLDSMSLGDVFRSYLHMKWMELSLGTSSLERANRASEELGPLSVRDFIDEEVEDGRRPLLELFLVQIPSRAMLIDVSRAWYELLLHHKEWRVQVSKWARFDHGNSLNAAANALNDSKQAIKHLRTTAKAWGAAAKIN